MMCLHDCTCADVMSVSILHTLLFVLNCMGLHCSYMKRCTCALPAAVSCGPAPDAPANGQRSGSGRTVGSTVTYTCSRGYTLQGDDRQTCMANGQWSGVTPRCSCKHNYLLNMVITILMLLMCKADKVRVHAYQWYQCMCILLMDLCVVLLNINYS